MPIASSTDDVDDKAEILPYCEPHAIDVTRPIERFCVR